jgi:hypothetical protein
VHTKKEMFWLQKNRRLRELNSQLSKKNRGTYKRKGKASKGAFY